MGILNDIIQHSLEHSRRRLIESATRANHFIAWAMERDVRTLKHYQDKSIDLDLIHDWLPEDRIYRG